MRVTAAGFIAAALFGAAFFGCVRFEPFTCGDDDHCVLNGLAGRCEGSGYCSFPDPTCESDFRYSEHAPAELARRCVVSGSAPDCTDTDGDGAGAGCEVSDCDDDNPAVIDQCVYLGETGDDANPGTRAAPWRTFAHAISRLEPGSSLVVLDGAYEHSGAGVLRPECGNTAVSGTATAPIFVRAEHSRQAVIDRGGTGSGIELVDCAHWRVRGLTVVGADDPSDATGVWSAGLSVSRSRQIELRDLFVHHSNRYFNEHGITVYDSEDVLLEDVEVHDFFRSGLSIYRSDRVTCRRCYGHSHQARDLPACPELAECSDPNDDRLTGLAACPKCSAGSPDRGDATFYVEHSNDVTLENCISEGSHRGFHLLGGKGLDQQRAGEGIAVLQSISRNDTIGFEIRVSSSEEGFVFPPVGAVIEDCVVIAPREHGVRVNDPDALMLRNLSILAPQGHGLVVSEATADRCIDGQCGLTVDRVLVLDAGADGLSIDPSLDSWSVEWSNIFGSGDSDFMYPSLDTDAFDDDEGDARSNRVEAATGVGMGDDQCRVYIPSTSSMHEVSPGGRDIGANVTERLVDRQPSAQPLWGPQGFACGDDPPTPAQIPGEQCRDLAARVGLGAGCPWPPRPG